MAESELDNKIKAAELRKLTAEAEKAESEKVKIDSETKDIKNPWRTPKLYLSIFTFLLGIITFGTFVIPNIIIPVAEHKTYLLIRQLDKTSDSLDNVSRILDSRTDSLNKEITLNTNLNQKNQLLIQNINAKTLERDSLADINIKLSGKNNSLDKQFQAKKSELTQIQKVVDSLAQNADLVYQNTRMPSHNITVNITCITCNSKWV